VPDQKHAADEHAILQEITAPLANLPDDPLPIATDAEFPIVLRGYDRIAVDAYVTRTSQLVAELQATRSPEAAVRRALERVGEQISGVLQRAHETAEQITVQSRAEAEDRLEVARQEATQITASAENRVKELDADTDRIWAERHRIVDDARDLARQLLELAEAAAERFPAAEETPPDGLPPVAAAQPGPVAAPQPTAEPEASDEPLEQPEASDEPLEQPEASDEPLEQPEASDEPLGQPELTDEPLHEPVEEPKQGAESIAEPEDRAEDNPEQVTDPEATGLLPRIEPYDHQSTADSEALPPDS
jgi:uncharacterized protein with HEPN domain